MRAMRRPSSRLRCATLETILGGAIWGKLLLLPDLLAWAVHLQIDILTAATV